MKGIGWETFGRIRAKLDAGLDRDAVLAEASIQAVTWMAAEEAALVELADDVERADFANLEAYRRAYQTTWTALTGRPVVDAPQPVESPHPPSPPPLPAWLASAPASEQTTPFPAWLAGVPAGDQTLPPLAVDERARNPLPFTAPTPAPPEAPVTSAPAAHSIEETLIGPGLVVANPLPFRR